MSVKQKLFATVLTVIFLGFAFYLIFINYGEISVLTDIETNTHTIHKEFLIHDSYLASERYKLINIIYDHNGIYAIVHLDNGNIKLISFTEAYIDPALHNVLEGYLYRENGQIYIRKE